MIKHVRADHWVVGVARDAAVKEDLDCCIGYGNSNGVHEDVARMSEHCLARDTCECKHLPPECELRVVDSMHGVGMLELNEFNHLTIDLEAITDLIKYRLWGSFGPRVNQNLAILETRVILESMDGLEQDLLATSACVAEWVEEADNLSDACSLLELAEATPVR